jgi:hexosaminidase
MVGGVTKTRHSISGRCRWLGVAWWLVTVPAAVGATERPAGLPAIVPAPAQYAPWDGRFQLDSRTLVVAGPDAASRGVAQQFIGLVQRVRAPGLLLADAAAGATVAPAIRFALQSSGGQVAAESYVLTIRPDAVNVSASDRAGLYYGAVTLWQLINLAGPTAESVQLPALTIEDAPRMRWRGLMLDSARHYQSPEAIERFIDWMALHKLNVLHWHLTDDQAWRLEIRRYPRLTDTAARRVPAGRAALRDVAPATGKPRNYGGYYSQATVRHLVAYAAARNVTIVPEIEMPGHASATLVAYPQLAVDGTTLGEVPADWGIYPNLYNVEDATFEFLENVLREVMELFPGTYIHVGGDEAVKDQWRGSTRVQQLMRERGIADEARLQSAFVQRIGRFLAAHGRRLVGWDEILEGGLAPDATVMSWRGVDGARAAAQSGHDAVLAAWPTLYFDNRQGDGRDEPPGRGRVIRLQDVYDFQTQVSGLDERQLRHLIGIQGNVWTEHIRTDDRVESMTWPRAAAVAELGWSPLAWHDFTDFRRRLAAATGWYERLGLRYSRAEFVTPQLPAPRVRFSQELATCSDKLVLNLEDDAPVRGERARYLIDIMNPCWTWRGADLSGIASVEASVGQVPFNFQLGRDRDSIRLPEPTGTVAELEVRLDDCAGELLARMSLAPALDNDGLTTLPAAPIKQLSGAHDLCLRFTGRELDPMWALHRLELRASPATGAGRQ